MELEYFHDLKFVKETGPVNARGEFKEEYSFNKPMEVRVQANGMKIRRLSFLFFQMKRCRLT